MKSYFLLILGMAIVTYIPRFIPFSLVSQKQINPTLKRFLSYIPYTALGALIIPDVFSSVPDHPQAVWGGIAAALLLSWWKENIILSVLTSVGVTYLILQCL